MGATERENGTLSRSHERYGNGEERISRRRQAACLNAYPETRGCAAGEACASHSTQGNTGTQHTGAPEDGRTCSSGGRCCATSASACDKTPHRCWKRAHVFSGVCAPGVIVTRGYLSCQLVRNRRGRRDLQLRVKIISESVLATCNVCEFGARHQLSAQPRSIACAHSRARPCVCCFSAETRLPGCWSARRKGAVFSHHTFDFQSLPRGNLSKLRRWTTSAPDIDALLQNCRTDSIISKPRCWRRHACRPPCRPHPLHERLALAAGLHPVGTLWASWMRMFCALSLASCSLLTCCTSQAQARVSRALHAIQRCGVRFWSGTST